MYCIKRILSTISKSPNINYQTKFIRGGLWSGYNETSSDLQRCNHLVNPFVPNAPFLYP